MSELSDCGDDRIVKLDPQLRSVSLHIVDADGREHVLDITLSTQYPLARVQCFADLPPSHAFCDAASILEAVRMYERRAKELCAFWRELEDIDKRALVMDRTASTRRIALGQQCTLTIELSAVAPRDFPDNLNILGPDKSVLTFQQHLAAHRAEWYQGA
ncbi:hypothetical protein HK105_202767 [Polyrhizophydium stewartii]|uniref:Uncharacterized protein n=1 Tax=Polyrhizophydium stewartii TaxID=2732419 RepID=A0ABR4NDA4_9FUNG